MTPQESDRQRPRRVRPYPLDGLPRILRSQVELGRVFWRHFGPLIDALAARDRSRWAAFEPALGGPLELHAQDPYLCPSERLPALLRGAELFEVALLKPGQPQAILAFDCELCRRVLSPKNEPLQSFLSRAISGLPLRLAALTENEATASLAQHGTPLRSLLVLDLSLTAPKIIGWARLIAPAELRLSAAPPPSPEALLRAWNRRARLANVDVELGLEAGYGFLPGGDLIGLAPSDIVLLDRFGPKPVTGGPVWMRLGGGVFPGHLDGSGVTVLGSFYLRAPAMPQNPSEPTSEDSSARGDLASAINESLLRELPVQITCEIGRITLSAREVLELRPGAVVPVGRPLAGPVDLTAGGRVIARGELVDVEGEIGIRVTEVSD